MLVDLLTSRFNPHKWGRLTKSRRKNEGSSEVMHITDIMRGGDSPTFSFEFFPPKTPAAAETLYQTIRDLESYMPHFVSVTYGAGGSTRDLTHDLVERIKSTTKLNPIPHLTCVCHNEQEIDAIQSFIIASFLLYPRKKKKTRGVTCGMWKY